MEEILEVQKKQIEALGAMCTRITEMATPRQVILLDKEQVEELRIPAGSPAGTYTTRIQMEPGYKYARGYVLYPIDFSGLTNFRISIDDGTVQYLYPVSFQYVTCDNQTPINERLKFAIIPTNGNTLNVTIQTFAALGATDFVADLIFGLTKK